MNRKKIHIDEGSVQETLLIPLYARAIESKKENPIIYDPLAIEIVDKVDYNFSKFDKDKVTLNGVIIRSEIVDELTIKFIKDNPNVVIINFGAGLCTRFSRVDDGKIHWFDLDFSEIIKFKLDIIDKNERLFYLEKSVFDYQWIEEIKTILSIDSFENHQFLFIAEGLFIYLKENDIKDLFIKLADTFPNSEIVFEVANPLLAKVSDKYGALKRIKVKFDWGVYILKSIQKWDIRIKYLGKYYYYNRHKEIWGFWKILSIFPPMMSILRVAHFKFLP